MRTIWKYELELEDEQTIDIPYDFEPLSVQTQDDKIFLWVALDTESEPEPQKFHIVGTGNPIPEPEDKRGFLIPLFHLGTVQTRGGKLVWHVFEEIKLW